MCNLREAVRRSEVIYNERHVNLYVDTIVSDEDTDMEKIFSYYINEKQDEVKFENEQDPETIP